MIDRQRFKEYINNIKSFFKEYKLFKKIKSQIIITKNEIRIESIDTQKIYNKGKFIQYLTTLTKKHSPNRIVFNCCIVDDIKLQINSDLTFINCEIENLNINQNESYSSKFEECRFNFCKNSQKLLLNTSKIYIKNCTVEVNKNLDSLFKLGNLNNSTVNIQNLNFINNNTKHFYIKINSENISLNNCIFTKGIELNINNNDKSINSIHIRNSDVMFAPNCVVDVNIILIENSNINGLILNSESVEIDGKNHLNNVNVLCCNDILINEDANLTLKNTNIKSSFVQCSNNSEINDNTNRLNWLTNVGKIKVGKNFILKHNNKIIYEKSSNDFSNYDNEGIIESVKRGRIR